MRHVIWLAGALALAGCQTASEQTPVVPSSAAVEANPGYRRPTDPQALEAARQAVMAKMKDPDSVKFTDLNRRTAPNARGEPTDVVCGKVNAKNSYGGYTGAKPFAYMVAAKLAVTTEQEIVGPEIVRTFCGV